MVDAIPYIPDIFKELVERVNEALQAYETPIEVLYNDGIYSQVSSDLYKGDQPIDKPLIWLVMPYTEDTKNKRPGCYCKFTGQIIIAMGTSADYTNDERKELIFKPYLVPVFKELLKQISLTGQFGSPDEDEIEYRRRDWGYWGGGEAHLANTDNLFKHKVDAIQINGLSLDIEFNRCEIFSNF